MKEKERIRYEFSRVKADALGELPLTQALYFCVVIMIFRLFFFLAAFGYVAKYVQINNTSTIKNDDNFLFLFTRLACKKALHLKIERETNLTLE